MQPVPELHFYKHHLTFLNCFVNILVSNNTVFIGTQNLMVWLVLQSLLVPRMKQENKEI